MNKSGDLLVRVSKCNPYAILYVQMIFLLRRQEGVDQTQTKEGNAFGSRFDGSKASTCGSVSVIFSFDAARNTTPSREFLADYVA